MAGHLADLLTTQGDRISALWVADADGPSPAGAPRLLAGAVCALVGGGEDTLLHAAGLTTETPDDEVTPRLDSLLRHVDALGRAAGHLAAEAPADEREALHREAVALQRSVAVEAARLLSARASELRAGMAAKNAALGITVHELRRPLTILTSYAELLTDGTLGELPSAALTGVQGMSTASDVLMRLIEALAEVARLEDPDDRLAVDAFTVGHLLEEAVDEVIGEAHLRGIGVEIAADAELPMHGDRRRLVLAITNLLSNAVKHAPTNSVITVRGVPDGGTVRIAVIDHGPGFPPKEAERLFEKYYRSVVERESGIPGTGLGLFIVRTVAERHGGSVAARVAPGGGAEFELTLPLV
ncbi:MAG TPA: HAMP domain-containing sensor histidine kinase [Candidatus Dormibacteraeota bacterium]|jgi:signal transduction histidine kinase|nr:HAMP domain-containing sensor histidine kinase [Candidatus Dormibacteraeota bacterium]